MGFQIGDRVRLTRAHFRTLRRGGTFGTDELYDLVAGVPVRAVSPADGSLELELNGFPVRVWTGYLEKIP